MSTMDDGEDRNSVLREVLEQSRDTHRQQSEILRKVNLLTEESSPHSETYWLLDSARDALMRADALQEELKIGSTDADQVLSKITETKTTMDSCLNRIRKRILVIDKNPGDEDYATTMAAALDYASLKLKTEGNSNFRREFEFEGGPFQITDAERGIRRKIALTLITQNWYVSRRRKTDPEYFADRIDPTIPAEERVPAEEQQRLALLHWVAWGPDDDQEPTFNQTTIAKILDWQESKVSHWLIKMKDEINNIVEHQPGYTDFDNKRKNGAPRPQAR